MTTSSARPYYPQHAPTCHQTYSPRLPNDQLSHEVLREQVEMFGKELFDNPEGPHAWNMDEKAYWEELASFAYEIFYSRPDDLEKLLEHVRQGKLCFELRKYFKAHPDAKEATGYWMMNDAHRKVRLDTNAVRQQVVARQINNGEAEVLCDQAHARCHAVNAIADASIPGGRHALFRLANNLVLEQLV